MFVPKGDPVLGVSWTALDSNVARQLDGEEEEEEEDRVKYSGVWSALIEDEEVDMRSTFIGLV